MPYQQAARSVEPIQAQVTGRLSGLSVDVTADPVWIAFVDPGSEPDEADWVSATWDTDATTNPDVYLAWCLVGDGGDIELIPGRYDMWVKWEHGAATPTKRSGVVVITGTAESS